MTETTDNAATAGFSIEPLACAALFATLGVAPPPPVATVAEDISSEALEDRSPAIEAALLRSGAFAAAESGPPFPTETTVRLLDISREAEAAITFELHDAPFATLYQGADEALALCLTEAAVAMDELRGAAAIRDWVRRTLTEASAVADGVPFRLSTDADGCEALLTMHARDDRAGIRRFCETRGWAIDLVESLLQVLDSGPAPYRLTAVRPGEPGIAVTRVWLSARGAWMVRATVLGASDPVEFCWDRPDAILPFAADLSPAAAPPSAP